MLRSTTSICPRCKRLLNAQLLERDGRVVLARVCPDHGPFEAVVYGHLHLRSATVIDGVRFDEVSLGYPKQWNQGKTLADYLRQVL